MTFVRSPLAEVTIQGGSSPLGFFLQPLPVNFRKPNAGQPDRQPLLGGGRCPVLTVFRVRPASHRQIPLRLAASSPAPSQVQFGYDARVPRLRDEDDELIAHIDHLLEEHRLNIEDLHERFRHAFQRAIMAINDAHQIIRRSRELQRDGRERRNNETRQVPKP